MSLPWIDTHAHLDAAELQGRAIQAWQAAQAQGVGAVVIPAVCADNWPAVQQLAQRLPGGFYALGIHPVFVPHAQPEDLDALSELCERSLHDPRFVAIGEIGLDLFVPELRSPEMIARQEWFYHAQLQIARKHDLPVLLHVRRSQDLLLKGLRRFPVMGGLAHAFNGSHVQAQHFLQRGFALGMGGAMTWTRALQIRRLATELPLEALVLETDCPDIPSAWLAPGTPHTPEHIPRIGAVLAELRGCSIDEVRETCGRASLRHLPRLRLSEPGSF